MESSEILTFKQAQELLKVSKNVLLYLIHNEEISAFRVGKQWRITLADLMQYIDNHKSC